MAAALAAGCAEAGERSARGSLEQGSTSDGSLGWQADEGTGEPIALLEPDADKDAIVPGADGQVPRPESDAGFVGRFAPDPPAAHDAGAPPPEDPVGEPIQAPVEEPDAGVTISLGLCDLLESLICAEGLECVHGVCTEQLACASGGDCDLGCSHASSCEAACDGANKCKVDCKEATSCTVSCVGANNCEPRCHGGSACEIDCRDANNCDHVVCEGDAECLVRCGEDTNCKLEKCQEPRRCSGDILVCNRECPPGSEEIEEDD